MKTLLKTMCGVSAVLVAMTSAAPADAGGAPASDGAVFVNRHPIDPTTVAQWRKRYGAVLPGRYWYDTGTGAWGREGGPTFGWVSPGLPLPGPLPADASGGGTGALTGVFINGRELHPLDVRGLTVATGAPPWRGYWWMDAAGNFGALAGAQRGPVLGNILAAIRAHAAATGGPRGPQWGIASPDGKQFIGHDGTGYFGKGSRGETYFP